MVLFPEGTYVPGRVGPGKHRLIRMLLRLQDRNGLGPLPFLPVGLSYRHTSPGFSVTVKIGPPRYAPQEGEAFTLTHTLMQEIAGLSSLPPGPGPAGAAPPGASPAGGEEKTPFCL